MAKFIFKLEALLKQRRREEQECQRLLAEGAAVVNALQEALRQLNQRIQETTEDVRRHLLGQLDMGFLAAHRRFMLSIQRKGGEMAQKLAQTMASVEEARVKLSEAARRRKAIEKLREKQFDRWRADQARKETALTDEIGSQIGYRNMLEVASEMGMDDAEALT